MKYLDVYIEESFLNNQTLTYSSGSFHVEVGMRVNIMLRNRSMVGFVANVYDPIDMDFKVSEITGVIDDSPLLNSELFEIASWMKDNTLSPMIRCLQTILPNKLKPKSSATPLKYQKVVYLVDETQSLTQKQEEAVAFIKEQNSCLLKDLRQIYSGYKSLVDKGVIEVVDEVVLYQEQVVEQTYEVLPLTADQKNVFDAIKFGESNTYLLHGVTGSGKTEVYLQAAQTALKMKRQVLILVPEISLTPQMIRRVSSRFGEDVAIYHSALNDQEKYEQYMRVKNNEVRIVVGTRSSVFMPFECLGLIVVDEEHDLSYKQTNVPYYHTRDIAVLRSEYHHCPLILGSASPALESYARALKGNYTLLELHDRINHQFPTVTVIDTQAALRQKKSAWLTTPLLEGIQKRLDHGEQVILLLNRRGYHTLLKVADTNQVLQCQNCEVALNYHKEDRSIRCHQCGYQTHQLPIVNGKPVQLVGGGVGTQRLQEQIEKLFPQARVTRMDADSTQRKGAHERILTEFIDHKYDILIGTQMIAKGLDIENVTLVGIINADETLAYTDYRSIEMTFDLLLQASGRAGRGKHRGEVMIQTFNPDHYAVICAVNEKYKHFFKQEMSYRKVAQYPPYSYLISLIFQDEDDAATLKAATLFESLFKADDVQIIGPTALRRLQNKHRNRIILKGKDLETMIEKCGEALEVYKKINKTGVVVDVNPMTLE